MGLEILFIVHSKRIVMRHQVPVDSFNSVVTKQNKKVWMWEKKSLQRKDVCMYVEYLIYNLLNCQRSS